MSYYKENNRTKVAWIPASLRQRKKTMLMERYINNKLRKESSCNS